MDLSAAVERAAIDPEFRDRLKRAPREACAELGIALPETVNLVVAEDRADTVHLVLPVDDWAEAPSFQEVDRTAPEWGMSICSKSYSCCCGSSDPVEEETVAKAA